MTSDPSRQLDPATVIAWVAAIHGIDLPKSVAAISAVELDAAARHARAHEIVDATEEVMDFRAILSCFAEKGP